MRRIVPDDRGLVQTKSLTIPRKLWYVGRYRTLSDVSLADGMSLYFFSDRDGQTGRVVTAFLTKR